MEENFKFTVTPLTLTHIWSSRSHASREPLANKIQPYELLIHGGIGPIRNLDTYKQTIYHITLDLHLADLVPNVK